MKSSIIMIHRWTSSRKPRIMKHWVMMMLVLILMMVITIIIMPYVHNLVQKLCGSTLGTTHTSVLDKNLNRHEEKQPKRIKHQCKTHCKFMVHHMICTRYLVWPCVDNSWVGNSSSYGLLENFDRHDKVFGKCQRDGELRWASWSVA